MPSSSAPSSVSSRPPQTTSEAGGLPSPGSPVIREFKPCHMSPMSRSWAAGCRFRQSAGPKTRREMRPGSVSPSKVGGSLRYVIARPTGFPPGYDDRGTGVTLERSTGATERNTWIDRHPYRFSPQLLYRRSLLNPHRHAVGAHLLAEIAEVIGVEPDGEYGVGAERLGVLGEALPRLDTALVQRLGHALAPAAEHRRAEH